MLDKPIKYPMTFKAFLRHAIGGRLRGDRLRIFRRCWCAKLKAQHELERQSNPALPPQSDEDRLNITNTFIEIFSDNGCFDEKLFAYVAEAITHYRTQYKREQRINAANSRWKMEKSKEKALRALERKK